MDRFINALREINAFLDLCGDEFTDDQLKEIRRLANETAARTVAIRLRRARSGQ